MSEKNDLARLKDPLNRRRSTWVENNYRHMFPTHSKPLHRFLIFNCRIQTRHLLPLCPSLLVSGKRLRKEDYAGKLLPTLPHRKYRDPISKGRE